MEKISRFIVIEHYHDKRFANETGVVLSWDADGYHTDEVLFDDCGRQHIYESEGKRVFEAIELLPSNQSDNRDEEFEEKLKEALISLLERGGLEISSDLDSDYDGKIIKTKVLVDGKEIYSKEERISSNF